ncbi:hypothetical protein [Peribacillus sp. NPDC058075]
MKVILSDCLVLVDWNGGYEIPAGKASQGRDPAGAKAPGRLPDRPRKASA